MALILMTLLATVLHAQHVARASALQRLQQILASQSSVNWVQTPVNSQHISDATHVTASLTGVTVEPAACALSFKDGRSFPDQKYETVQTWKLKVTDVDRIQVDSLEAFVERLRAEGGQARWD